MSVIKIGIVGNGFVGGATSQLGCDLNQIKIFDCDPEKCQPFGITMSDIALSDIIFVAVPTPANEDGSCYLKIVETVVEQLREIKKDCKIVIRSTVPPGTSKRLGCMFMPEFLTEKNAKNDFINNPLWIFGSQDGDILVQIIKNAKKSDCIISDNTAILDESEAELIKYVRNCFLATKVSFFNEVYDVCQHLGVNFEKVRLNAAVDKRIGLSHTIVPGPDGKRGFGGHCFPKDALAWIHFCPMEHSIVKAVIERNLNVDRPEKDWQNDKGRAVV